MVNSTKIEAWQCAKCFSSYKKQEEADKCCSSERQYVNDGEK